MTNRDFKQLEELANRGRDGAPETPSLDDEHARLAARTVEQLDESVRHVEQTLRSLGMLLEDYPLPKALIGAMGMAAVDLRRQVPALKEAVKEVGG